MTKTVKAPAKINLYLDVMSKRADGYHNIKSVMQSVSLHDTVTVSISDRISVFCNSPEVPTDEHNIAYKAAKLFFEKSGISGGVKIEIDKKIPVAGGLAGGSTDAAAVLSVLNSIYGTPLSENELFQVAAMLGADVPFCLKKGCAACYGVGEIINDISSELSLDLVIAKGGEGVSTPAAYNMIDRKFGDSLKDDSGDIDSVIYAMKNGDKNKLISSAYNIFESVVLPRHTGAGKLKELMYENGAEFAMMSGSGPSVFGIFPDRMTAEKNAEVLTANGYVASVCKT